MTNSFFIDSTTKREYTREGFLKVPARVSKAGTYEYLACEIDSEAPEPMGIVRVHRSEATVFDESTLRGFAGIDVTMEHPSSKVVTAANFKATTCGVVVGPAYRDGDFVAVDMIIKDAEAITQIEAGKNCVSVGYSASYERVTDKEYDYEVTNITPNHIAITSNPRCGAQVRLADSFKDKGVKPLKIKLVSGKEVDITDSTNAALIADSYATVSAANAELKQQLADAEKKLGAAEAEKEAAKAELAEVSARTCDSAIAQLVSDAVKAKELAVKIAGDSFTCDSFTPSTILREALKVVNDSRDWAQKSDDYVQAFAEALAATSATAQHSQLATDIVNTTDSSAIIGKYRQEAQARDAQAWLKNKAGK